MAPSSYATREIDGHAHAVGAEGGAAAVVEPAPAAEPRLARFVEAARIEPAALLLGPALLVGLAFGPALLGQSVRPTTVLRAAAAEPRLARERRAAAALAARF